MSLFLIGCSKTPPEICASITNDEIKQKVFSLIEKDQYFYGTLCKEGTDCLLSASLQEKFKELWNVVKNKSEFQFRLLKSAGTSSKAECLTEVKILIASSKGTVEYTKEERAREPWMPIKVIVYKEPFKKIIEIENLSWYKINWTPWRATSETTNAANNPNNYYPISGIVTNHMRMMCVLNRCSQDKSLGVGFFDKPEKEEAQYWERTYNN